MPVEPIHLSALGIDLSSRVVDTTSITGSPSANAETIIATLTIPNFANIAVVQKIYLMGWASLTVGTSGTALTFKLRQTDTSGATIATTGALTGGVSAGNLLAQDVSGSDAAPGIGKYVMTLTVTGGAATSTVSAVQLLAVIV